AQLERNYSWPATGGALFSTGQPACGWMGRSRGRGAEKSTDPRLGEADLVTPRLYSTKSLSCDSNVAITSASKNIALVTSVASMVAPKAPSIAPSSRAQSLPCG